MHTFVRFTKRLREYVERTGAVENVLQTTS